MNNIGHKTQLSAEEIKIVINAKTKEKGIEIFNVVIGETITFNGIITGKLNSNFSCEVGIKGIKDYKLTIELCDLRIEKLGILKGATSLFIKGLLNKLGNNNIIMKGNNIVFNIKELQEGTKKFEMNIDNVYIKDKLLNIEGKRLKEFKL
ncbi:MAG: hypothetical protein RSC24_17120 [Clostridium sp.]